MEGVISGRVMKPPRVVLYGKDGIGKTTWAAGADRPIFLPTEEGADEVGAARFPLLTDWRGFVQALGKVAKGDHDYRTVVLDSLDWLERMIWADVAKEHGCNTIEEVGKGFGKGYNIALDWWRRALAGFDACRANGMVVILLAHSQIKRFDSPEVDPYDRYCLKMKDSASAMLREWADVVAFAGDDVSVKKADVGFDKLVVRGQSTGRRSLRLVERPAYDAKNRYGLPDSIPFPKEGGWDVFVEAMSKRAAKANASEIVKNGSSEKKNDSDNSAEAQKEEVQHG